jgi:capsular polysaccharide biosynthesis protein
VHPADLAISDSSSAQENLAGVRGSPQDPDYTPIALNAAPDTALARSAGEGALGPYLRAIRGHRLLILMVTLAAIGASAAWIILRTPEYKATADLLVTPLPQEDQTFLSLPLLRDSGDPTRTVQTAATVVESGQAAQRTARTLGRGWTPRKVLEAVDVQPQGESNILAVTATAEDAPVAARIANAFARGALDARSEAVKRQANFEIQRCPTSRPKPPP